MKRRTLLDSQCSPVEHNGSTDLRPVQCRSERTGSLLYSVLLLISSPQKFIADTLRFSLTLDFFVAVPCRSDLIAGFTASAPARRRLVSVPRLIKCNGPA